MPHTKLFHQASELLHRLTHSGVGVNLVLLIAQDSLMVNLKYTDDPFTPLNTVNVAIAAYTTAQARLHL